jgi:DNA (cytosine-5)-methyltransferase 1
MRQLDPKKVLLKYYKNSYDISDITSSLPEDIIKSLEFIISRVASNKGVYTVLITLALYKIIKPTQDIRNHKIELSNGFSGRSFDTKYVTPTLKQLKLPAMAESGWLTRSLEQAYPYDMNFNGKITPIELKWSFLKIVGKVQESSTEAEKVLRTLLNGGIQYREDNLVEIKRISSEDVRITNIINLLNTHFNKNYHTHGGSKLPVIAFYAVYTILINEMERYQDAELLKLGSHTASDRTSKSAGDIEVVKNDQVFEAVEIKLDKPITPHLVRLAYEKINKFSVSRYYILSGVAPQPSDLDEINQLIFEIEQEHGCQLITNGLYNSLGYYLRLVSSPKEFLNRYIELVENDTELELTHKNTLKELIKDF